MRNVFELGFEPLHKQKWKIIVEWSIYYQNWGLLQDKKSQIES